MRGEGASRERHDGRGAVEARVVGDAKVEAEYYVVGMGMERTVNAPNEWSA